ncbi:hypothetical protein [Paenibacillus sedimenti]|uniref:Uncharacterized protein n=1 Tax=Paenibacillus sedimenti TaxID=2770274 RepID=A0A926KSI9_9BACL|nr:hypothetical protein [Paenibacillus sedimenti]MBD0381458.1 hypothetical protein [Paenibacillus sedimenti]
MNSEELNKKIRKNNIEIIFTIVMATMLAFVFLQVFIIEDKDSLKALIQLLVQVNITAALAIAALVASIGTFRWEHYIKALMEDGMADDNERKIYIIKNAKNPLYRVLALNSIFVIVNVFVLFTSNFLKNNEISIVFYKFSSNTFWEWMSLILVAVMLILLIGLTYYSLKYMKELLYR